MKNNLLAALLFLLPAIATDAQGLTADSPHRKDILDFGAKCDGSTDDSAAFLAATGSRIGSISIPYTGKPCVLAANVTLTLPLVMAPGAEVSPSSNVTLTLGAGFVDEANTQAFTGTGRVRFNGPSSMNVYSEWFGGKADGLTNNNNAWNKAVQSIINTVGGNIIAQTGTYLFDISSGNAVDIRGIGESDHAIGIVGQGMNLTSFIPSSDSSYSLFNIDQRNQGGEIRDFTIKSPASVSHFTALDFKHAGVVGVERIQCFQIGTCIDCGYCGDMVFDFIYAQNCGRDCVVFGGGPLDQTGAAHVALNTIRHLYISENNVAPVACIRVDSGANSMKFFDTLAGGCAQGMKITNTYAARGAHRPEDIEVSDFVSDLTTNNLWIEACWGCRFYHLFFGLSTGVSVLLDNTTLHEADQVDGVIIDASYIRGAKLDDVEMVNACNLVITGSTINSAGAASPGAYAAIHAASGSCGMLQITGNNLGGSTFADERNSQRYSVLLDSGSLATIGTCGSSRTATCSGQIVVNTNNMCGNAGGGTYQNNGASPSGSLLNKAGPNPCYD